jgi:hypothetical protein
VEEVEQIPEDRCFILMFSISAKRALTVPKSDATVQDASTRLQVSVHRSLHEPPVDHAMSSHEDCLPDDLPGSYDEFKKASATTSACGLSRHHEPYR